MIRTAFCTLALLATTACAGPAGPNAQKIDVADDTFYVRVNPPVVIVHNFATGVMNQTRLFAHAQQAAALATDCALSDFRQEPGANTYTGTLTC